MKRHAAREAALAQEPLIRHRRREAEPGNQVRSAIPKPRPFLSLMRPHNLLFGLQECR